MSEHSDGGGLDFAPVGAVGDLTPGVAMTCDVRGQKLLVVVIGDEVFCLRDRCSHANSPLSPGKLRGRSIACPLHGARFDLRTGEHLSPPAVRGVDAFDARVVEGIVEIALPEARSSTAGDLLADDEDVWDDDLF